MIKKGICVGFVAFLVYFITGKIMLFGFHLHYYKHHPGTCKALDIRGFGSEDIQVTSQGLAFITSGMSHSGASSGYLEFRRKNKVKGRVLLYNFKNAKEGVVNIKLIPSDKFNPDTFRPHGISILEDKVKGEHLIYIINHPHPKPDVIEKFRFLPKSNELAHVDSIKNEALRTTNDLLVLAEDKFYVTNWLYYQGNMQLLEGLASLPLGGVLYYNGTGFKEVVPGLIQPNGISTSRLNRFIYIAMPMSKQIWVYRRKDDNSLLLIQKVPVYTSVDNFHISPNGKTLYAGAHPIGYKTLLAMHDPGSYRAPSQVLKFPLKDGKIKTDQATELFYDHGTLISASTVGVSYENSLLIGSLMDTLVICEPKRRLG